MKIVILSRNAELYSTKRLVAAGQARDHVMTVVDPLQCYMDITSRRPRVFYRGEQLEGFDAVIPRIATSITFYGSAVLRQLEMMGVYPLNESVAIGRSRDKLRSLQLLARKDVNLPTTGFAHDVENTQDLIALVGGPPVVVKLLSGSQGKGIVLAETQSAAESVIDAFRELGADFLVQEFIREAAGTDIRCFIVGDRVVGAMMRRARAGDFRSNLHRGGESFPVRLSPTERATAVRAANTMGLNVAGVDLLRTERGPVVLEVNASPGLEGIEWSTGRDIAGEMVAFIEKRARPDRTRTRGKG